MSTPTSSKNPRTVLVALAALASVGIGITPGSAATRSAAPSGALGASGDPGTLIGDVRVAASGVDATTYLVNYWSRSASNAAVNVTGLVFVPSGTPPAGGWPVVSYGHPTDGMAPSCAPSLDPSTDVPNINAMLDRGWEVVATDYEGEANSALSPAPSGLQPHGVNLPTARDIIDIVRAATQLPEAHASTNYVVWGYSQGATAAAFVGALAASYAPELHLDGVVATAPSTGLVQDFWGAPGDSASPFTLMYVAGYHSAYGDLVPLSALTDVGMSLYDDLGHECFGALVSAISPYRVDQVFTSTQLDFPLALLLLANDPGFASGASTTPVLLVQGTDDTTNPAGGTILLAFHLCALGQDTVLWQYPGLGHDTIVGSSQGDVDRWIADRFAGSANPDPTTPTGVDGVQRAACN